MAFVLFLLVAVTTVAFAAYAYGIRHQIETKAPEYAQLIYRTTGEMFLNHGIAVRSVSLFSIAPPEAVRSDIQILRCLSALNWL